MWCYAATVMVAMLPPYYEETALEQAWHRLNAGPTV